MITDFNSINRFKLIKKHFFFSIFSLLKVLIKNNYKTFIKLNLIILVYLITKYEMFYRYILMFMSNNLLKYC